MPTQHHCRIPNRGSVPQHPPLTRLAKGRGRLAFGAVFLLTTPAFAGPWPTSVTYDPGTTPVAGFTDPTTALGAPERFTGEGVFPGAVTMFNPAFGTDEIVSIGEGGHLTVSFDEPVQDDPGNLHGVDLIIFGNTGFIDSNFPNGQLGNPAGVFGSGLATVEVSADGTNFFSVDGLADGLFPAQGYLDVTPFQTTPGIVESDFRKPMDPSLTLSDFDGLSYAQALALYDGSGGGTPIDIGTSGLTSISHVRISLADDGDAETSLHAEIDAFVNVPEPASISLLLMAGLTVASRRRRRQS
ncbi:MAG: PEP-CTERM sorting domain-containing protein [Phycisphaerales bacterium]|nr:PEP-CTERM sorting domain-containing protein [Phycisphaerales bacterium]